ncbi:Ca2+:H+ antiporter [Soonwooa buanensis]|uniref:Ca2+:H+ antiporter n=1 Tax=Soonwooa buanensis TaxID=619805 RepID=A0A1T5GJ29_9FLAO|nr:calcium:proton antiporter [Soonwooa buanensis]SKC08330.1 Ca2+:H+ antiporter [Soonwooa buanensis]
MSGTNKIKQMSLKDIMPSKTRILLILIWLIVIGFSFFGHSILGDSMSPRVATLVFLVLLVTIIAAAFGVVKEADELAYKLGEPYGTLILTLAIVSIEVVLIAAVMLGPGEVATIGKDSIFSVMMIIMNLVIGLCILLGGKKYGEQEYNSQGTMSYIAMIIMLGGLSMLLPNFIQGAGGGVFTNVQAVSLSVFIVILYGFFLAFQVKGYSHLYIQPKAGFMEVPYQERLSISKSDEKNSSLTKEDKKEIWIRVVVLILMILPIVLLSHNMAKVVNYGIKAANLPPQLGGVLIAFIVFTPESITSVKATLNNEFQRAINLCHGAFVSTVGLTVPAVLTIGLITGKTVLFGLTSTETILFIITLLLSIKTFAGKRTTPFVGIMHLVLFATFILLIFNP